jgi:hypothetical protein
MRTIFPCWLFIACLLAGTFAPVTLLARPKYFRCVNKDQVREMFDQLPPWCVSKGYEVLDDNGRVLKVVPPQRTQQEVDEAERNKQYQLRLEARKREQEAYDERLLSDYQSVEAIESERDRRLGIIAKEIRRIERSMRHAGEQLGGLVSEAAELERAGLQKTDSYYRISQKADTLKKEIVNNEKTIKDKEFDKQEVRSVMNGKVERFRVLKERQRQAETQQNGERSKDSKTGFICADRGVCMKAWDLSRAFAEDHATTAISQYTNEVIATEWPADENDLSIRIEKLPRRNGHWEIVIEFYCGLLDTGQPGCEERTVEKLRRDFHSMLHSMLHSKGSGER